MFIKRKIKNRRPDLDRLPEMTAMAYSTADTADQHQRVVKTCVRLVRSMKQDGWSGVDATLALLAIAEVLYEAEQAQYDSEDDWL